MGARSSHNSPKLWGSRGATMVEYALLITLCAGLTIGAVTSVGSQSSAAFSTMSSRVNEWGPKAGPSTSAPSGGGGGAGMTTSSTDVSTPTSSDPVATMSSATWSSSNAVRSGTKWTANATLLVVDDLGQPISAGAVTVVVRFYQQGSGGVWSWQQATQVVTTGADGSALITAGPYKWSTGRNQVTQVELSVQDVTTPDGLPSDGTVSLATLSKP